MEIALGLLQVGLLIALLVILWRGPIPQAQTTVPKHGGLFQKLAERISPRSQAQPGSSSFRERMSPQEFADHAERRYIEIRQKEESEKEKANAR